MPSSNPSPERLTRMAAFLSAAGWKQTTITVFGIEHEAWINPRNGKVSKTQWAYLNERNRQKRQAE